MENTSSQSPDSKSFDRISTFIFAHDQQIILNSDAGGKFRELPNVTYVLLGNRPADIVSERNDIIIARHLDHNIEQYASLCSFTGWYVLWKNGLIKTEYVNLFEYDVDVRPGFMKKLNPLIEDKNNFIGYVPLPLAINFITSHPYSAKLQESLQRHYNIGGKKLVRKIKKENRKYRWSSTSNSTFDIETFNQYMYWFENMIGDIKDDRLAGHAHERSLSVFCYLHKKKISFAEGAIQHRMANSHGLTC